MLKVADAMNKDANTDQTMLKPTSGDENQTVIRDLRLPHIDATVAHDLDALIARVFSKDTTSTVGFVRRLSEIAEEQGATYSEMSILVRLRLKLHIKEGRYTDEQVDEIADPALKRALGIIE